MTKVHYLLVLLTFGYLTLSIMGKDYVNTVKREAFLEGQRSVYHSWATDGTDGTPYTSPDKRD